MGYLREQVIIPAGKCPVNLESTDEDSVLSWVEEIKKVRPNQIFTAPAYRYWAKRLFEKEPEKTREVVKVINKHMGSKTTFQEMRSSST